MGGMEFNPPDKDADPAAYRAYIKKYNAQVGSAKETPPAAVGHTKLDDEMAKAKKRDFAREISKSFKK